MMSTYIDNFLSYFVEKHFDGNDHPYIALARKEECQGMQHLDTFFQDIMDHGGEGIILRDPKAPYQPGRSRGFLKHKVLRFWKKMYINVWLNPVLLF